MQFIRGLTFEFISSYYLLKYKVNKTVLIEKIDELIRDKKIEGVSDLRDERD